MRVAVLGAGNGGCTFAAHLSMLGHHVHLYESDRFKENLEGFQETGEIEIEGAVTGKGRVAVITTDMKEALDAVEVIIVPIPGFAQDIMIESMIPHLREGQAVIFFPGNYASLRMYHRVKNTKLENKIIIAESNTMLYACRRAGDAKVSISGIKNKMPVAAMPADDTPRAVDLLNRLTNVFFPVQNVLQISMDNPNCVVHCVSCVLNTGWIETTRGDFDFYWEGMSEGVCKVMEGIDTERLEIGKKLGISLMSLKDAFLEFYGLEGKDIYSLLSTSLVHGHHRAPQSLADRYVSEDVPFGLVPLSELGKKVGVPTPAINSIISIASMINKTDYGESGITLRKLGLDTYESGQIMEFVEQGICPVSR